MTIDIELLELTLGIDESRRDKLLQAAMIEAETSPEVGGND